MHRQKLLQNFLITNCIFNETRSRRFEKRTVAWLWRQKQRATVALSLSLSLSLFLFRMTRSLYMCIHTYKYADGAQWPSHESLLAFDTCTRATRCCHAVYATTRCLFASLINTLDSSSLPSPRISLKQRTIVYEMVYNALLYGFFAWL